MDKKEQEQDAPAEKEELPRPFITLTQRPEGSWSMDSNMSAGQAKWTICEVAAAFLAELQPKR